MYKVQDLVAVLGGKTKGELRSEVSGLAPFFHAKEEEITFAADKKFLKDISKTKAKVVIVPPMDDLPEDKGYIVVDGDIRKVMPILLKFFKKETKKMSGKLVEDSAVIGEGSFIAPTAYIGHDVKIGKNVEIHPGAAIYEGVVIGDNTTIYANVTIREFCELGEGCIIQPGAVIGGDGFGYTKVDGKNVKIDQIGRVVIGKEVEVGSNATIDCGAIGDTIVKDYTKIDNLVMLGHNDIIGENCLIVSQVGIAGSTEVGDNTTLAGQVGVNGHIKIGSNVIVGAKSGIQGDIPDNQIMSGLPLVPLKEDLKIRASIKKLPELLKKVKRLEKKVEENN